MIYDFVVATTACNRPDLHSEVFPEYCKFLEGFSCLWLINVDCIPSNNPDNFLTETNENLKKIIGEWDNIDLKLYSINEIGGWRSFFNSVLFLTNEAVKIDSNVFWIEDDWGRNSKYSENLKGILSKINFGDYDFMSVGPHNEWSLNPGIYGKDFFKEFNYARINNPPTGSEGPMRDPERAIGDAASRYGLVRPNGESPTREQLWKNKYHFSCFYDSGRGWVEKNCKSEFNDERIPNSPLKTFTTTGLIDK
jgi:hypothetical protein